PGEAAPGIPGPNKTNGPSKGLFFPALSNWSLYRCPLHPTNTPAWRGSAVKFTSYVMNGCVINGSHSFDWDAGALGNTYKGSSFKATDMLFWEPYEKDPNYFNDGASDPSEGLTQRHYLGAIIGMLGGHAV